MNNNKPPKRNWSRTIFHFIIGVIILGIALSISVYWMKNKPKATRKAAKIVDTLIAGKKIKAKNHKVIIKAMGTVVPAKRLDLKSRVSGEIIKTNKEFFPGGYLKAGEIVVEIDKTDYRLLVDEAKLSLEKAISTLKQSELAIKESQLTINRTILSIVQNNLTLEQNELAIKKSQLTIEQNKLIINQKNTDIIRAQKDLSIEMGQQKIAFQEYKALGEKIDKNDENLVLRQPQLKAAKASLEATKSKMKEAENIKKQAEATKESALLTKKSATASIRTAEATKKSAINAKLKAQEIKNQAEASRKQAIINLEKAKLNLKRTTIRSPFNAVIQNKKVEIGSQISINTPIVDVIDTNEYWVEITLTIDKIKWINTPKSTNETGSTIKIYHHSSFGNNKYREGKIKRLMTNLDAQNRMSTLLATIKDPLSLKETNSEQPPIILGAYVKVEIIGNEIKNAFKISRNIIHDMNTVWIKTKENTLDIRKVEMSWNDSEFAYITNGLKDDEFIITSNMVTPIQGMRLKSLNQEEKNNNE